MIRSFLFLTGAALIVSGCGDKAPTGDSTAKPPASPFNDQVKALREPARNLAFRNAIRDFNVRCERVDRSAYQEEVKGSAMWVAQCTDTGKYAVFVSGSGYAQVARCEDLTGENMPHCTALD